MFLCWYLMEETESRYTFIVAEPSLGVQKLICYCIQPYGDSIPVYTATGLFKKLESTKVDFLITEIDHWDMGFEDLYAKITADYENLPVIFITSRSTFEVKHIKVMNDSDILIHKPFKKEWIVEAVEYALDARKK